MAYPPAVVTHGLIMMMQAICTVLNAVMIVVVT